MHGHFIGYSSVLSRVIEETMDIFLLISNLLYCFLSLCTSF